MLWLNLWHYAAYHLREIAPNVRALDCAMRWGFAWAEGPFEAWQACDWSLIAAEISEKITHGRLLRSVALPRWVSEVAAPYRGLEAYSAQSNTFCPQSNHPVYQRQLYPLRLTPEPPVERQVVFSNDYLDLWHQGDQVLICSFKTKMHVIDYHCIQSIDYAIDLADPIIWVLFFGKINRRFAPIYIRC